MNQLINVLLLGQDVSQAAAVVESFRDETRLLSTTAVDSLNSFKQSLKQEKINLVITEVHLAWLDIQQVLLMVRQTWPNSTIILYTAEQDARLIAPCFKLGVAHYIAQPDIAKLQETVQEALATPQRSHRPPDVARRERLLEALGHLAQQFYAKTETGTVRELLTALCPQFDVSRVRLLENKTKPDAQDQACELQAELFYEWVVSRKQHEPRTGSEPICYAQEGLSRWVDHLSQGKVLTSMVETLPTAEADFVKRTLPGTQLLALIPVFSGGHWWGILELTEERPRYIWSHGEIEAFMSTASILGAAVEIQRLVQVEQKQRHNAENLTKTLQRQASELRELFSMAISLSETLEPAVLLRKLYEHINALFAPDIFIATLYDAETDMVEIALALEEGQPMDNIPQGLRLPLEEAGATGWVIRQKQTVFIEDTNVQTPPVTLRRISEKPPRTWLGTPLIVGQKAVGVISLQSRQPYAFDQNNGRVVETLAAFIGLAVDNSRLFQQETRRRLGAEALASLATAIIQDSEQGKILDSIVEAVIAFMPDINNCRVFLFNEEMTHIHVLRSKVQDEEASILLHELLLSQGPISLDKAILTRRALDKDAPLVIYDLRQEEGLATHALEAVGLGVQSLLLVPMRVHGRVVGMLDISVNNRSRHFSEPEINLCQSIANYGAVALQNARLREAEQNQFNLAKTLHQVGSLLTSEYTLDEVYEQIFDLLDKVIDYEKGTIQLYDAQQERLFLAAMRGFDDWSEVERMVNQLGFEHVSHIMTNGQPYRVIADTQTDPAWVTVPKFRDIRSSINCLLRIKDRVIGILNVDHTLPNAYTDESARIVLAFANQAAIALENARLYDELSQRISELSIINQVTMVSTTSLYLDELLAQTTAVLAEQRFPDYVGFYLLDEVGRYYIPHHSFHTAVGLPPPSRLPLDELHSPPEKDHRQGVFLHEPHPSLQPFLTAQVSLPMRINEKVIGLMTVGFVDAVEALNEDDFSFLQTIAGQLSTAVQRAGLYEDAQLYAAQLSDRISQRTGELQAEKDRTQAILDTAGEGIFFTDPAGKILYANEAIATQSGYLVNEIIGQPIDHFYHAPPAVSDQSITILRHHISAKRVWRGEIDSLHRDGTPYTVSVNVTPLTDSLGTQSGFVIVQADITHLKEVERLKTEFVSNVSHELRTPLTNIKTYLTLLRRGKPEKAARYLDVLDHETERLARLIQDLLNLSRLDTQSTVMNLQPVLLTAVVEDILPALYTQARQHTLTWSPQPTNLHILADTEHLQQTITRLVHNAIAYTPRDGKITLTAGQDHNPPYMVYLRISDNGPGLTPEDQEHLFERFFRGTAAIETQQPGTGLGLAISKEIINRHRGYIEAHNNPDQGVTFTIWLPKENEE